MNGSKDTQESLDSSEKNHIRTPSSISKEDSSKNEGKL